ncbi:zinc ABC transporter substrate-binding protein [Paenibacillus antri]|uniref:Zinc ABC transporter substrate-binding protein n=1 Tax=Paenibacillus antri TaxID=2582848 RepID=A0A5R9G974_9BACL|nr:metal ABC transporter substrate-binding protein [Paenibacillus antri]TLS52972.1 zinc ABC transporter substrate-binding protein [Paenibacillus antri]
MKRMKRNTLLTIGLAAALAATTGCASQSGSAIQEEKVNVVTSFFPLYDFARTIGGEYVNAINMIPAGVEPHDWTPKSQDMANITKAQVFAYQGAGFEGWTDDVLGGIDTKGLVIVEASRGIELMKASENAHAEEAHAEEEHAREEEHADEHAHEHEEEHADEHAAEQADEHAAGDGHNHGDFDPHTWLSPRSAMQMASNLLEGLKQADPAHAAEYERNFEALKAELAALDKAYTDRLSQVVNKEMVVSHQAFGYLARDYGLVQMPIMGLTPDGEPTAHDLKKISDFVKEHDVRFIFTEELVSDKLAKTLANDLGVETLPLHPLEGLTEAERDAGETYISLMEKNLEQLAKALK